MAKTRMTSQRIKILEYLKSVTTHPTAEMVYSAVKNDLPAISLATVYRNLHKLADEGTILKLEVNGEFHFDGDICHHQHCVCKSCGKITDLFREGISKYALKNLDTDNFNANCVNIIFYGTCKKCKT